MEQSDQKESKQNDSSLTVDASNTPGFQFSYIWPVRTPEMINAFVNCAQDTELTSKMITNSFQLDNEEICLDWYISAFPNAYTQKNSSNLVIMSILLAHLPVSKNVHIKSLRITHLISIPQLHILIKRTNDFENKNCLG